MCVCAYVYVYIYVYIIYENNDIQQMHFSMFIIYTNTPTCILLQFFYLIVQYMIFYMFGMLLCKFHWSMWWDCVWSLCDIELCVVKAIFRPVLGNRFVIFLIVGLWYVNVIHFLLCCCSVVGGVRVLFSICELSLFTMGIGYPLDFDIYVWYWSYLTIFHDMTSCLLADR
jgi:hypothetical protein